MREHGTRACYVWGPQDGPGKGCRCTPCSLANSQAQAARNRSAAPPYVDAGRARRHVEQLMADGFGLKAQAKAAGVSATAVSKMIFGDPRRGQKRTKRIRPATEKALLGLTLDQAPDSARTIDPARYVAVLEELHRRGWTYTQMAERIGCAVTNLRPNKDAAKVTAGRYRAAAALLDEHPPLIGADDRGHNAAAHARAQTWDPAAERREKMRRAAEADARAKYRALAKAREDDPPTLDAAALAAQEWRRSAACRLLADDERWIFWAPEADRRAMDACRAVCASCRVADDCLAEALRSGETGFWGGRTERERERLARRVPA